MTKFQSRVCSFIVAIVMMVLVFPISIVNAQTNTLLDGIKKTIMATSVEKSGEMKLTFKAEGLSKEEQQNLAGLTEILNKLEVNFNTKVSGNSKGTILRQYFDISAKVAGSPYKGQLWSDMNLTGKTPIFKVIVKSPQLLKVMLPPEYANKYMLMDFEHMKKNPEMKDVLGDMDFGKMIGGNKDLQQLILAIIKENQSKIKSNYSFITKTGNVYRVKIDDAKFKYIIRKVVNSTAKNKNTQKLISDFVITQMKNNGASTAEINDAKAQMKQLFNKLQSKEFSNEFNQMMDKLKDVKILKDKGIDISFTVDKNGYVISTKGDIELVVDMAKLDKIFGSGTLKGKYTVGIKFEVNNKNINGKVNNELPKLTSTNSFNFEKLFEKPQPPKPPTAVIKPGKNTRVDNKVTYVQVKDIVDQVKGKYTYSKGKATITVNGKIITLTKGQKEVKVNGKVVKLKHANGIIYKDQLYIPIEVFKSAGIKFTQPKPVKITAATVSKSKSVIVYNKVNYVKVNDVIGQVKGKYTYSKGNATMIVNGKTITLTKGEKYVKVNGKRVNLKSINGHIYKDKLYIPLEVYKLMEVNVSIK
jgi:hypothetical protein